MLERAQKSLDDLIQEVKDLDFDLAVRLNERINNERPISVTIEHNACHDFIRDINAFVRYNPELSVTLCHEDGRMVKVVFHIKDNRETECKLETK